MNKLTDFKVGMWVICKEKTIYPETFDLFLQDYPLGVAQIYYISTDEKFIDVLVKNRKTSKGHGFGAYCFRPEDLEIIDGQE